MKNRTMFSEFFIFNFVPIVVLLIVWSFIVSAYAQTEASQVAEPDAAIASDLDELLTTVYCYCGCTRETIEVCTCGTAMNIENNFRERLLAGETVEQIRTSYLDTHGPQYYAVMPVEGINLLAYAMPIVILLLIGSVVLFVLRKSTRSMQKTATADKGAVPASQVSDATVQQVEAELARFKRES